MQINKPTIIGSTEIKTVQQQSCEPTFTMIQTHPMYCWIPNLLNISTSGCTKSAKSTKIMRCDKSQKISEDSCMSYSPSDELSKTDLSHKGPTGVYL